MPTPAQEFEHKFAVRFHDALLVAHRCTQCLRGRRLQEAATHPLREGRDRLLQRVVVRPGLGDLLVEGRLRLGPEGRGLAHRLLCGLAVGPLRLDLLFELGLLAARGLDCGLQIGDLRLGGCDSVREFLARLFAVTHVLVEQLISLFAFRGDPLLNLLQKRHDLANRVGAGRGGTRAAQERCQRQGRDAHHRGKCGYNEGGTGRRWGAS
mmetsp:Transcript_75258/g.218539  ORF Transcript_75258/g.218539 Transcript_75258/m.218539 type:complete len:209 (-) Transcript_75258:7-633(-)